jgi:hypothetical protein
MEPVPVALRHVATVWAVGAHPSRDATQTQAGSDLDDPSSIHDRRESLELRLKRPVSKKKRAALPRGAARRIER